MSETALRDRRRAQTQREIADAALDLFEAQGVEATTVEQVAARAGVSPRTFFRHVASKERAALVPHSDLEERVAHMVDDVRPGRPLLEQLEAVWREVLVALDDGRSDAGRLLLRVRRLILAEPSVRLAALGQDEERLDALVELLTERLGLEDDLEPRLVCEVLSATVRLVLDRWADSHEQGHDATERVDLLATWDQACRLLRGATGR